MGQAGIHGPCLVGAIEHLVKHLVHNQRQTLSAKRGVAPQRRPTAFNILRVGFFEPFGRCHRMGFNVELASLCVATDVERKQNFRSKLAPFFEHRIDRFRIHIRMFRNGFKGVGNVQ